jgi:hypothetical protein
MDIESAGQKSVSDENASGKSKLKSLVKETAIYGLSSIVGKFINYLLVTVYTVSLPVSSGGYGVITNMYAITALLLVLLTYGMETGFFRFANKSEYDPMKVYSTTIISVGSTVLLFLIASLLFLKPIAGVLGYSEHPWYIGMMLIVVAMDAFQSILFAFLRYKRRPGRFVFLKLLFISTNILLNIIYYVFMEGQGCRDDICHKFDMYRTCDDLYDPAVVRL